MHSTEIESNNRLVKVQVFELLSALSVYSQEGHALALDALEHHKVCKRLEILNTCVLRLSVCTETFRSSTSIQQAAARAALQRGRGFHGVYSGFHQLSHSCSGRSGPASEN